MSCDLDIEVKEIKCYTLQKYFIMILWKREFILSYDVPPGSEITPCITIDKPLVVSALDKLLGQLGIYATWLSSIAYLQKQLRIFIFFYATFFSVILPFLIAKAIGNVLAYLFTHIVCLSKVSNSRIL